MSWQSTWQTKELKDGSIYLYFGKYKLKILWVFKNKIWWLLDAVYLTICTTKHFCTFSPWFSQEITHIPLNTYINRNKNSGWIKHLNTVISPRVASTVTYNNDTKHRQNHAKWIMLNKISRYIINHYLMFNF